MAIETRNSPSEKEWEQFLRAHPESNFLQSWYYGEFYQAIGHSIHRLAYVEDGKIIGLMLGVIEDARRGRYMSVAGGPILDWQNHELVNTWALSVQELARTERCVFVRVRPQLISNDFSQRLFTKVGFVDAPMHLSAELTSQLDLSQSEDEILAGMRQQTRYEIRKAQKLGIKVESSIDTKLLKNFYELQVETAKRQGFVPFRYTYLCRQFEVFANHDAVKLYTATHDGKVLAQAFVIFYGTEAAYHYGVSTQLGRAYPGAPLIQWQAICDAKKAGLTRYNFWGVAPADQPRHRFHGVSVFKRGFGGDDVEYLHAQDLVMSRSRYTLNLAVEKLRKHIRRV